MLSLPRSVRIYVASTAVDMRMGHDGLFAVVREQWRKDPFTGHLFVFFGRAHDRVRERCETPTPACLLLASNRCVGILFFLPVNSAQ
jgi:transposase